MDHVSINKMSKKMGSLEGNTTLPMEHGSVIIMAILNSEAGMSNLASLKYRRHGHYVSSATCGLMPSGKHERAKPSSFGKAGET